MCAEKQLKLQDHIVENKSRMCDVGTIKSMWANEMIRLC